MVAMLTSGPMDTDCTPLFTVTLLASAEGGSTMPVMLMPSPEMTKAPST